MIFFQLRARFGLLYKIILVMYMYSASYLSSAGSSFELIIINVLCSVE